MRIFSVKGIWQIDFSVTFFKIMSMDQFDTFEMFFERVYEGYRECGNPVFVSLAATYRNRPHGPDRQQRRFFDMLFSA